MRCCSIAKIVCACALIMPGNYVWCNDLKTVHATYMYHAPAEMSVEQARQTALHRAMSQAIADEFGMMVTQSTTTAVTDTDGETASRLTVNGQSEVRGEWIETIGEPEFDISFSNGLTVVKVSVKGRARELDFSKPVFSAATLRGDLPEPVAVTDFNDGDMMCIRFEAPASGFVAVYCVDNAVGEAYRLLPYALAPNKAVAVEGGIEYLFFSRRDAANPALVDELELTCANRLDLNDIYVLYSPAEFLLPEIERTHGYDVRSLPINDFNKWLAAERTRNRDLQLKTIYITIKKS